MSNIYIQEPPTSGKVLMHTTVGDIDIELWSKEAPKACRNFVQLCMENYYNGTIFHRVVKGFIAQGGDPSGDGTGGESIYGKPFKDEFHTRLRFVRRGLVAMANAGKDDNGSQFFFTLDSCPDLQNKHTIFGKVTGDTLYNMLRLEECVVDKDDRPMYPHKVISTKVLSNPFPDITPRVSEKKKDVAEKGARPKEKVKKNFKLLSFGDEAEEEEMEVDTVVKAFKGKSKSSHDLTNDPKLSSVSASELYKDEDLATLKKKQLENIKKKLKNDDAESSEKRSDDSKNKDSDNDSGKLKDREMLRQQIKELTKELRKKPKSQEEISKPNIGSDGKVIMTETGNPLLDDFHKQLEIYANKKSDIPKDKEERQKMTLALIDKFKNKIQSVKEKCEDEEDAGKSDDDWLAHKLEFEEKQVVAKDANMPSEDRYDITDPRNPINKRRRGEKKRHHRRH